MKEHKWIKVTINGGPAGDGEFFRCESCGAAGGPTWWRKDLDTPKWDAFYPGENLRVGDDCNVAASLIKLHDEMAGLKRQLALVSDQLKRTYGNGEGI